MTAPVTPKDTLTFRALEVAKAAPAGSLKRRAAGCAAAVLATTSTVGAARRALVDHRVDDGVRDAALALIDDLTRTEGDPR